MSLSEPQRAALVVLLRMALATDGQVDDEDREILLNGLDDLGEPVTGEDDDFLDHPALKDAKESDSVKAARAGLIPHDPQDDEPEDDGVEEVTP